jgi:serine/threonine protein kinase
MSNDAKRDADPAPSPLDATVPASASAQPIEGPRLLRQGDLLAGRYLLTRFIAAGGMGEVWEVRDERLGELVALKAIRPDKHSGEALKRFELEVKLSRRVTHPNVCRVFDVGQHTTAAGAQITFLTMELLEGTTLSELLERRGPFTPAEAVVILKQVALGLDAAHAAGVVHRDLKGSNIFMQEATSGQAEARVVITDFGIARSLRDQVRITAEKGFIGTPAYMAPEQVEGGEVGPAGDVYSLGVVTFELVTGTFPFGGQTPIANALARLAMAPRSLESVGVSAPAHWQAAMTRVLSRNPADRFAKATDFVAALEGPQPQPPVPSAPRSRWRAPGIALGLTLVLGLVAAATSGVLKPKDDTLRWSDLSTRSTNDPQAIEEFREAIRLYKDRSGDPRSALMEAVRLAPDFAEAWVQLAFLEAVFRRRADPSPQGLASEAIRETDRLGHLLSQRDAEFLQAIGPILSTSPDVDEAIARLNAFVQSRPRDAPAWEALGVVQADFAGKSDLATTAFKRSRALDPSFAGVAGEAILQLEQGETARAIEGLTACTRNSNNGSCSFWLTAAYDLSGDCVAMERIARNADYRSNEKVARLGFLLRALRGQGRTSQQLVAVAQAYRDEVVGRFEGTPEAREALLEELKYLELNVGLDLDALAQMAHVEADINDEVSLRVETGELDAAVFAARERLLKEELRSRTLGPERPSGPPGVLLSVQAGIDGGMTVAEYRQARAAWLTPRLERDDGGVAQAGAVSDILGAFAVPNAIELVDSADARAALALIENNGGLPNLSRIHVDDFYDGCDRLLNLAKLQLAAGQASLAAQTLQKAVGGCTSRVSPPYHSLLGVTLQRLGEQQKACASFATVVERWGQAKPRSITAEKARARAKELHCTEEIFSQPSPSADADAH